MSRRNVGSTRLSMAVETPVVPGTEVIEVVEEHHDEAICRRPPRHCEQLTDVLLGLAVPHGAILARLHVQNFASTPLELGEVVGQCPDDHRLADARRAGEDDALPELQAVLADQVAVEEMQLDLPYDLVDDVAETADVGEGHVGYALEEV